MHYNRPIYQGLSHACMFIDWYILKYFNRCATVDGVASYIGIVSADEEIETERDIYRQKKKVRQINTK